MNGKKRTVREKKKASFTSSIILISATKTGTWFAEVISFDAANKQNKKESTKWIKKLNDVRKITMHPERGLLSNDQVAFVNEIFEKVEMFLHDEGGPFQASQATG